MRTRFCRRTLPWVLAFTWWSLDAGALSEDEALGQAQLAIQQVEAATVALRQRAPAAAKTAEERLAHGEMFLRNRDYDSAIDTLNQVVELFRQGKANSATHADGLFLLGEAYFKSGQLPSARRQYRAVALEGHREAYAQHAGRALSRLVDISVRRGFTDELDFVFEQLARIGSKDASGGLAYAAGKANFAAERYDQAIAVLRSMPKDSSLQFQAEYLLGVVFTNQALSNNPPKPDPTVLSKVPEVSQRFAHAILQFQRVTQLLPRNEDEQLVVDLAWMALGRLFYETDNPLDAAEAYVAVRDDSPEYATALFELAWVYISLKDFVQARDTLEVLELVAPDSLGLAEGALLRADLALRAKEFSEALRAYESVRTRFGPAYEQLSEFLAENKDPAEYYDRLVEQRLGVRTRGDLPPVIMDWVREVEDERAFALIDDVTRSRDLTTKSTRIAKIMGGILSAPTRARAFPDLRAQLQDVLALNNRLSKAKALAAVGVELASESGSAELTQLRARRKRLSQRVAELPVEIRHFLGREADASREWDEVSQTLQQLSLESDNMRATVNGLRRMLREADQFGLGLSADRRRKLLLELRASEADLGVYQDRIAELREELERGRLQVGFGGKEYVRDARLRKELDEVLELEFALVIAGHAGEEAREYGRRGLLLQRRATAVQQRLKQLETTFEAEVAERAAVLFEQIQIEAQGVRDDSSRLDVLDQQARQLFGEIAMRSFAAVREKLGGILLRADIGIAQEAWEVRQTHYDLVRDLQRTRSRRERALSEEFEDVMFDGSRKP